MSNEGTIGRQRMKEFYDLTHVMFTKPERLILYKIMKDYRKRQDVTRLVMGLNLVLRTYTKLELLKYIRYFVWEGHLYQFDKLTKFHRRFRRRNENEDKFHTYPSDAKSTASTSTYVSGRRVKDVRVFTIHKERGESSLGFSVRGGSEHGIGIYVSDVDAGSAAEKSGLEIGDKILEVNNISLRGVASSSAIKVLTGSKRLKLVVQRSRKVPEWRLSREKTSWYDVQGQTIIAGDFEECGISNHIRGLDVDVPERRVNLKFGKANRGLGFNIRGGREYGLGIYVSKVDTNGLAETNGVRVGDQIIDVNGVPFDNITHANAVEVLKGKRHLILTLRDVGRFPVYKELYAEYTWSDSLLKASGSRSMTDINIIQEEPPKKFGSTSDLFSGNKLSSNLHSEIFLPAKTRQHHAHIELNGEDVKSDAENDSDSLIDLDQWAEDIQKPLGNENHGFEYEDEPGTSAVVLVHNSDNELHETTRMERKSSVVIFQLQNEENNEYSHQFESEYDTPDMLYAKINKTNAAYESSTNLSMHSQGSHGDTHSDNENLTYHTRQISTSDTMLKATENRLTVNAENISTYKMDGALYSTVRRLSGGSHTQLKNTELGIYGSRFDVDNESDSHTSNESLSSDIHNNATLQLQGRSRSYNVTPSKVGKTNDKGMSGDTISPYHFDEVEERDDGNIHNELEKESSLTVGVSNDVDMDTLEDKLRELQKRQESIGLHELNALDAQPPLDELMPEGSVRKKGKWSSFKKKIKGSLRLKSPKRAALSTTKSDDYSQSGVSKSKLWKTNKSGKIDSANMASLEEAAKPLLDNDEFSAVIRHIKTYHETRNLEALVDVLLVLLDKPEKVMLLKDIRGVIYNHDLVQYDNMVNTYEIEAYQKLSLKLHLPLNHKQQKKPRRNLMTAEIAEGGHFHIRPMEQTRKQRDVIDVIKGSVEETKIRRDSNKRQNSGDDNAVLDHFEYLDLERVDEMNSLAAFSDHSHSSNEVERIPGSVIVHLSKNKSHIGIDLEERDVGGNKEVKIAGINPNGAANDDSTIEVGMILLGVDRYKVDGLSVDEVWAILDKSYMDKRHVSMKLILIKDESTNF